MVVQLKIYISYAMAWFTVNSTAAIPAIQYGKPVKVCGKAIYDIKGLTFSGDLSDFWNTVFRPDFSLTKNFLNLLANEFQVRGNFYSAIGSSAAAESISRNLLCSDCDLRPLNLLQILVESVPD